MTLRKIFSLIERETYGKWAFVAAFTIFVSIIEASGALLIALIAGMIVSRGEVDVPQLGTFGDLIPDLSSDLSIWVFALIIAAFFVMRAAAIVLQSYAQGRLAHNAGVRLSGRLLRQYLQAPYSFHLRHNSAELIRNVLPTIVDLSGSAFQPLIMIFGDITLIAVLLIVLVLVSDVGVVAVALILGALLFVLLRRIQPRLLALGALNQEAHRLSLQFLQQALEGVREIKLLGKHRYFERQFLTPRMDLARAYYARAGIIEIPRTVLETSVVLFILVAVALTLVRGGSAQGILVTLGLLAYASFRILPALNRIVSSLNTFKFGAAAVAIIHEQVNETGAQASSAETGPTLTFNKELTLEDISFSYDDAPNEVLRSVNLTIPRGRAVGIVGPTGSGKSTLLDIVTGLLPPSSGNICVDGVNVEINLKSWQNQIGFVPQSVFLLDDTLRRNIAIGVPDDEIDDERIAQAIAAAQLADFVSELHGGVQGVVGERGARISGGERQRIAIARALYGRPTLLILDEGTSALDTDTEQALIRSLAHEHGSLTLLMVAHRVTSLRFCDQIVVLEKGTIARLETYEELIQHHVAKDANEQ